MGLWDFFTPEQGQKRRKWLEDKLQEHVAEPMNYFLGPTGIPGKVQSVGQALEYTDAGDMAAAADASRNMWNNPTLGNAAELTAAGIALGLPMYSSRLGEGIAQVADDMVRAYDPNTVNAFRVWHGSPHDFDKFDMGKIGTGEGAQAYGHGLYFAESGDVAREYRDALSGPRGRFGSTPKFKALGDKEPEYIPEHWALNIADFGDGQIQRRLQEIDRDVARLSQQAADDPGVADIIETIILPYQKERDELALLLKHGIENDRPLHGSLYEVAIDAEPEDFLDWDLPLSAQPRVVRDGLKSRIEQLKNAGANFEEDPAGDSLWRASHPQGGIDKFDFTMSAPEQATKRLNGLGIKGIRYYDQGSRGAGEGTRNYVLFDDALAHILSKNGKPMNTPEAQRMRGLLDF